MTSAATELRKALSDLADAATRGATRGRLSMPDFEREMRTINTAYASGLDAVKRLEPRPDFDPHVDYPERYTDGQPV